MIEGLVQRAVGTQRALVGAGFSRRRCWLKPAPTIDPIAAALLFLLLAAPALAQQQPFVVHDTRAVVMHGPYVSSLTETSATIVWVTDTPCHAEVAFGASGAFDRMADNAVHGLLPVGVVHVVHVNGLEPGTRYQYKTVSTRVVKMKAYWPEKGLPVETPAAAFTTFDRKKITAAFAAITDTHEDAARVTALLKLVDPAANDFLVHLGDAFHGLESEDQLFGRWYDPASKLAAGSLPLFYVRGNHEMRGAFARQLADYVPNPEGRYYFSRDVGPIHLIVLDTGEDKADDTNVYSRLNRVEPYREQEFAWLKTHLATEPRVSTAPFRVVLLHQPRWGWTNDQGAAWTELANAGKIDVAIGGHHHRFFITKPGEMGNAFPVLALGQDQVARVTANATELTVTVLDNDGKVVETLVIPARR